MRCRVECPHLCRGFVVPGELALGEVAVPRQRPDLLDSFPLGHPEMRRASRGKWVFVQIESFSCRAVGSWKDIFQQPENGTST